MNSIAFISIGSNIGDRLYYLHEAVKALDIHDSIVVIKVSSIYETDPVGFEDQDHFLNMVIKVKTELTPYELLRVNQEIEHKLGRKREIRWGPRTLDLDILLYNHENIETKELIIPHPRMTERAFVIVPLEEVESTLEIPNQGKISLIINELLDREGVRVWKRKNGVGVFGLFES